MGRLVYAEESLLNYLETLTETDAYTVGVILGQNTEDKDYVVHLARTPPPASKDVIEETLIGSTTNTQQESPTKYIKSINEIPSSWVADHVKHVTRMLPGGMSVLGIFIVAPTDCLTNNDSSKRLRSIVTVIQKNLQSNPYLYGNNREEYLILAFNSQTKKYLCKSFDINGSGTPKVVDWKFQSKITKWQQLETHVDLNEIFPVVNDQATESLKKQFQNILENISKKIESAIVVIEGTPRSLDELIEVVANKKKKDRKESQITDSSSNNNALQAAIYIPCSVKPNSKMKELNCSASLRLIGQLVSRTFVNEKATIAQAATAIRQDIMRSMASRLEMHWDSLIEEENGLPEDNITLHEPPRRVLVALPQSRITLSDYLFPGEGPQEALISLQELLDLEVHESCVQKEIELQADPQEFYCQNEIKTEKIEQGKFNENNPLMLYISGLGAALIVIIIAILLHFLY